MINYKDFAGSFLPVLGEFQKEYSKSTNLIDFVEFLNSKIKPLEIDIKDESEFFSNDSELYPEQYDFEHRQTWAGANNQILICDE